MKPNISVLMPVYNASAYLSKAIESILAQTFHDYEFIIINDGSTDHTPQIVEGYKDTRIRFINNEKNLGLIKSLNIGLQEARGKYIARMDGDDIAMPERLDIQFNYLEKNQTVFLLGSAALIIDEMGGIVKKAKVFTKTDLSGALSAGNCLIHPSIMFRAYPKLYYREKMLHCEDYDFYLRLVTDGLILKNIEQPLIKYRISPHSISRTMAFFQRRMAEKSREFFFQRQETGFDHYDEFDLDQFKQETQGMDLKSLIWAELTSQLSLGKTQEARSLCKEYLALSFSVKVTTCYILSFFGSKAIRYIFN